MFKDLKNVRKSMKKYSLFKIYPMTTIYKPLKKISYDSSRVPIETNI